MPAKKKLPSPAASSSSTSSDELSHLKSTDLTAFNKQSERRFCELVDVLLVEIPQLTPHTIYQEASFELNVSVATAKRYFVKHTARRAAFGVDQDGFVFRKF